jgi:V/A-type H+/Na+-transporting ATPase subunit I
MFAPVPMVRVRIQVAGRSAAPATHAIARLGLLHLIDIAHGRADSAPAGSQELLAAHRASRDRFRRVLDRLGSVNPAPGTAELDVPIQDFDAERQRLVAALEPIEDAVTQAWTSREDAMAQAGQIERALLRAQALAGAGLDGEALTGLRFATAYVIAAGEEALASLSDFVSPTPHRLELIDGGGRDPLGVLLAPASARPRVDTALRLVHVEAIDPATVAGPDRLGQLGTALHDARGAAATATGTLASLAAAHIGVLHPLLARAETCVLLLQAQERFGATGRFIVISGWIPESDAERLRAAVMDAAPGSVVDVERPSFAVGASASVASVPILHRNPLLLRPFQPLIELYDTPSYRELQPTPFFAVSFLLMFGLMFGDAGHGAVLALAGYYLFRYVPQYLDYGILLMEAGSASAMFGILYGSLFGIPGALPVIWLEPSHDLPAFMRIAVMLGVVLVSLGLILNVVNSWRAGQRASALFSVHGLFGAFLYWTGVALAVRLLMPWQVVVPAWMLWLLGLSAAALVLLRAPLVKRLEHGRRGRASAPRAPVALRALEGSVELVDALFAYVGNTVSFIRIAAFAAVHAGLFVAMFAVADTLAQTRYATPLTMAVLVIGNVVLILLEGLTVSVQVLRLEYYEFFGKFFRGGGERYHPLMLHPSPDKRGPS